MQKKLLTAALLTSISAAAGPARAGEIFTYESGAAGFHTKTFFYDTGREVVAFDAQFTPAEAKASLAFLAGKTRSPLKYLVITHPNPDKFNGAPIFKAVGAKVIASEATARALPTVHAYKKNFFENVAGMFPVGSYPALAAIDETFSTRLDLTLEAGHVELRELGVPAVSGNQTVAILTDENAVVVGDLVHGNTHAWLEGGIVAEGPRPTLASWRASLITLRDRAGLDPSTLVLGGRGDALPLDQAVAAQIAYLDRAEGLVKAYVQGLANPREDLSGPEAGARFKALKEIFEKEFPGFAHPYLIEYGVYGLAIQVASAI